MRRLSGHATIHGVDDEYSPQSDETVTAHRGIDAKVSRTGVKLPVKSVKWGGECRVEVDASAILEPESREIHVSGEARLFEGTSENTEDLEDTARYSFSVPPDRTENATVYLKNHESGGGDHATVHFRLSNRDVPDVSE